MAGSPAVESSMSCKCSQTARRKWAIPAFIIVDRTRHLVKKKRMIRNVVRDRLHNRAWSKEWRRSIRVLSRCKSTRRQLSVPAAIRIPRHQLGHGSH